MAGPGSTVKKAGLGEGQNPPGCLQLLESMERGDPPVRKEGGPRTAQAPSRG
ncbi:Hypothetical predicted protein [Marmota monax]|uniref:Uncharacterized protein n=1 Tax=Marmota monax TaxID=9995 RepID=A0A5E4APA2_MARMO|nr:Hypothetical predicted protein [Marmota monax]